MAVTFKLRGRTGYKGVAEGEALVCHKPFVFLITEVQSGVVTTPGHELEDVWFRQRQKNRLDELFIQNVDIFILKTKNQVDILYPSGASISAQRLRRDSIDVDNYAS